jgi:hypothetical protein
MCGLLGCGSVTLAQGTQAPRGGGLFGGTRSDANDRHRLNFTFAVNEGYDSEVPLQLQSQLPQSGPQSGGYSTTANATAEYVRMSRRGQFRGTGESSFRYYGSLGTADAVSASAGLGGSLNLPARGTLEVNQTAAYSPSYLFGLFPSVTPAEVGETIPIAQDYRADLTESLSYRTNLALAFGSTQGTRFSVSGEYSATDYEEGSTYDDLTGHQARAGLSHGIGRSLRVSADYEYRVGDFSFGARTVEHSLPLGVEYSPALSATRRAILGLKVIPSTLVIPESAANTPVTGRVTKLQGEASASYPFFRSWMASARFRRNVEYVAVLGEPIFADTASVDVSGLLRRRLDLAASAGFAEGESALQQGNQVDSYTGTVRLRFALTRSFAAFSEYLYYRFDLRGLGFESLDLPTAFDQHGVRVGLTLWVSPF